MSKHHNNCKCAVCKSGLKRFLADQKRLLEKYGWVAHYVIDDCDSPTHYNAHTHGLADNYKHPDFQIVLPLRQETAHSILTEVADRVKAGEVFEPNKDYAKVIRGFDVRLVERTENDRKVLRIIFPAGDGVLDQDKMTNPTYAKQYE